MCQQLRFLCRGCCYGDAAAISDFLNGFLIRTAPFLFVNFGGSISRCTVLDIRDVGNSLENAIFSINAREKFDV